MSGSGVNGAIHLAAGVELEKECKALGGCKTGEAQITKGYLLPAKYIIHTVGPVYKDGKSGEEALLRSCYQNSLALAVQFNISSIVFPLISAGTFGYPLEQATTIAVEECSSFLKNHSMDIKINLYSDNEVKLAAELFKNVPAS